MNQRLGNSRLAHIERPGTYPKGDFQSLKHCIGGGEAPGCAEYYVKINNKKIKKGLN